MKYKNAVENNQTIRDDVLPHLLYEHFICICLQSWLHIEAHLLNMSIHYSISDLSCYCNSKFTELL